MDPFADELDGLEGHLKLQRTATPERAGKLL